MMLTGWQPDVFLPVDTYVPQSKYEKNTPWAVSMMQGDFVFLLPSTPFDTSRNALFKATPCIRFGKVLPCESG